MKFLSVCSGIESASVAWEPLGFEAMGFSEIEPFPCRVLKHHYPNVKNYGDLTKWREWNVPEKPDIIVGGTPCQDFSIAGKREEGKRANLTHEFVELCGEIQPEWIVWENVPGVLSMDSGRTFHRILRKFSECGYGWAYRVLNAQFFGVPQRRRRVFLVGHSSGDPRRAGKVLFEQEGLRGDIEKSGKEREEAAEGARRCATFPTLDRSMNDKYGSNQWVDSGYAVLGIDDETNVMLEKMGTLPARTNSGGQRSCVAFTQNDAGRDATIEKAPTLRSGGEGGLPQMCVAGFTAKAGTKSGSVHFREEQAPTIKCGQTTEVLRGRMVRRITPIEALRLQGLPDDYLINVPGYSDTQAYRAIGNSKAVPVVRWIGERIKKYGLK